MLYLYKISKAQLVKTTKNHVQSNIGGSFRLGTKVFSKSLPRPKAIVKYNRKRWERGNKNSKARHKKRPYSFICQGSRSRDNPNLARLVDVSRHNSNLAFTRLDNSRAVRTNQPSFRLTVKSMLYTYLN